MSTGSETTGLSAAIADSAGKRRYWIAIGLLLVLTLGYTDRVNFSVAGPHLLREFSLSRGEFGIVTSAFNWTYVLCLIPVGMILDKVGTRILLPCAIITWSVGAGLTGLATGFSTLIMARMLLGIGESPVYPGGNLVVREWAPATERGFFTGMLNAGVVVGPATGAIVSAYLIDVYGWQASFFILGGVGIVVALIWYLIYETPENAKWLSDGERKFILDRRDVASAADRRSGHQAMNIRSLLKTKTMWGLIVTNGCSVYTNYLFLSFLPLYLVDSRGMKDLGAGWVTGITYAAGAIGSLVVVAISDWRLRQKKEVAARHQVRRKSLIAAQLLGLPLLLLPLASSTTMIIVMISWVLAFAFATAALNFTLASDLTVDKASAGRMFSLVTIGGNLFGLVSPIVTGFLVDWTKSYNLPFIVAGALLLVGVCATSLLSREVMQPREA